MRPFSASCQCRDKLFDVLSRAMALVCGALLLSACTFTGNSDKNLFKNGSFEKGREPWFSLDATSWGEGFEISERFAVHGRHAAYLPLRTEAGSIGTKIFGVVQEVASEKFPRKISGYYRVENWNRQTEKQYVQFVVIVWGDPVSRLPNIQIRYILAGVTRPPFEIRNARFWFLGGEEPEQSAWIPFERDLHADFLTVWGHVPSRFKKARILFEARYDGKHPAEAPPSADVYFDQLSLQF